MPRKSEAAKSSNRWFYDTQIGPALLRLAKKAEARGLSMVALVEIDAGKRMQVATISKDIGPGMALISIAADTMPNVDMFCVQAANLAHENIIPHQSAVLQALGCHPDPAKRGAKVETKPADDVQAAATVATTVSTDPDGIDTFGTVAQIAKGAEQGPPTHEQVVAAFDAGAPCPGGCRGTGYGSCTHENSPDGVCPYYDADRAMREAEAVSVTDTPTA